MATKIQLEAMVQKILKLQSENESVHSVTFDPYHLAIYTGSGRIICIDTDEEELSKYY